MSKGCGCGCSGSSDNNRDKGCCGEGDFDFTSGIKWDGGKFVCGNEVYARDCDSLNTIMKLVFSKLCAMGGEVLYAVNRLSGAAGGDPATALPDASYTIPNGGDGTYEVWYWVDGTLPLSAGPTYAELQINLRKNAVEVNADCTRKLLNTSAADGLKAGMAFYISEVTAVTGDVLAMYGYRTGGATFQNGVIRIVKKSS